MKASVPHNEPQRLSQLRALNIINTPTEERFDRLTRLARRLFDVPIALVSLVEQDYQWFKSAEGYQEKCSPRNISFCAHTILQDEVLVVEDALQDARFHNNPLVLGEPHIRFYAGCPLRSPGGSHVGSLCLIDHQPRSFNAEDRRALCDLAEMAEAELVAFQAATSDELTQITNRRGFMALGQLVLNDCLLKQRTASLAFLDLDKFKQINDTLGHREGDRALMDFADAMKVTFRHSDLFARLGGDEFVVLFNGLQPDEAQRQLQAFREYLQQQIRHLERHYPLDFSSGIVVFDPHHPCPLEQLLASSDATMYESKKAKKARK